MEQDPASLLGTYVLIGITRVAADGVTVLEQGEQHGRIALVDPDFKTVRTIRDPSDD